MEHKLQQNFEPFLLGASLCSGALMLAAADTAVAAAMEAVAVAVTLFLSGSGAALVSAGSGSVSWLASGFLIP